MSRRCRESPRAEKKTLRVAAEAGMTGSIPGLLQWGRRTIMDVAASVGYQSPSRFAERFRQHFGLSPGELRATHDIDGFRRISDSLRRA